MHLGLLEMLTILTRVPYCFYKTVTYHKNPTQQLPHNKNIKVK